MRTQKYRYKGYIGSADIDIDNDILFGKILFIKDAVTYEATDPASLKEEFEAAVDDYLDTCKQLGREPQKSCSGTFNIRVGEKIHRDAAYQAQMRGQNLNDFCKEAIEEKIDSLVNGDKDLQPVVRTTLHVENVIKETDKNTSMRAEFITYAEACSDESEKGSPNH